MDWYEFRNRRRKAPATTRVPLCADREALSELEHARAYPDPDRARTMRELEEAVAEATMWVTVRELPAEDYMQLKEAHRPKDEELRKKGHQWDEGTFAPALIAASIDPPLTVEEATEWWHGFDVDGVRQGWTLAERSDLLLACIRLNEQLPELGFTRPATAGTNGTGLSSTISVPEG